MNPVNVIRMGLLGGIEASMSAIAEGRLSHSSSKATHNIASALEHLEAIGLGNNQAIAEQLGVLRKNELLRSLIDTYQFSNGPDRTGEAESYTRAHHRELMALIGALYMIDPGTIQQNIDIIAMSDMKASKDMTAESTALLTLHVSLQIHSRFPTPAEVRNATEAQENYEILMEQLAIFGPTFRKSGQS